MGSGGWLITATDKEISPQPRVGILQNLIERCNETMRSERKRNYEVSSNGREVNRKILVSIVEEN